MRQAPADLSVHQLSAALRGEWRFSAAELGYVAVGGGSHHWRAANARGERLWLSVDDLDEKPFLGRTRAERFEALRTALECAQRLHDAAGLEFVVAPLPDARSEVLVRLSERYALAVYPYLEGDSYAFGEQLPDVQQRQLLELLVRLHAATPSVAGMANVAHVEVGERAALEKALDERDVAWTGGPFAEDARSRISASVPWVRELLVAFDRLAAGVRRVPLVITHGEPHPGNLLMARGGAMLLVDWDTVGLAPAERDLWWLDPGIVAAYTREVDPDALELYRLRWFLDDLAYCLKRLRSAETPMVEAQRSWDWLKRTVRGIRASA
jgi:spectinomycin phosphotransferase